MWRTIIFLIPCVLGLRWSEYPTSSKSSRSNIHSLTPSSLVSFLKSSNLSVIWFHPKNISSSDKLNYFLLRETFLTPAASRINIPFAEFPITNDSLSVIRTLNVNETDIDTVHIYSNLRRIIYYGLRTPDALVSALKKFQCPKFSVIEGKVDKKEFDLEDKVRVLALVVPGSSFARAYAKSSLAFNRNNVKFYVITNPVVAARYGLSAGKIQLHRPGERSFVELQNPRSSADITAFVKDEAGKSYFQTHRLTAENIYSFFRENYNEPKFVLLTSSSHSPRSARFHKLIRRSIKNDTNCQIYVIDVDVFPGMSDFWRRTYGVDPTIRPALGYVSLYNDTAVWLERNLLNETDGRDAEAQNNRAIGDFVNSVLNGTISLTQGRRFDPDTGRLMESDFERTGGILKQEEGEVVDLHSLQDVAKAKDEAPEKRYVRNEFYDDYGDEDYESVITQLEESRSKAEKPYFGNVKKDDHAKAHETVSKFGEDLTSFGTHIHIPDGKHSHESPGKRNEL